MLVCPTHVPHGQICYWTRTSAVKGHRLTVFYGATAYYGLGRFIVEVSKSYTDTYGRTPLIEWSALAVVASCTTRNKYKRQTFVLSARFESAIPAVRRLQTYALYRTTTSTWYGHCYVRRCKSSKMWRCVCGWVVLLSKRPALLVHGHSHIPEDLTVHQRRYDNLLVTLRLT